MAKLVFARRIFPALGNANEFSLLSLNGKIAMPNIATTYCSKVDKELAKNEGKEVNVLIDSLGGSLANGLSISDAVKNHGKVNVHFVGLNA